MRVQTERRESMMANPRRIVYINSASSDNPFQIRPSYLASIIQFFQKPHSLPFLLSIFLFLTWISIRFQRPSQLPPNYMPTSTDGEWSTEGDMKANLVRFSSGIPSQIAKDKRGWLLNPVSIALASGVSVFLFNARERGFCFPVSSNSVLLGKWAGERKVNFVGIQMTRGKHYFLVFYPQVVAFSRDSSFFAGGAVTCASVHVGEIRPGRSRGNHRHHDTNETFVIWGATTKFRLENSKVDNGYAEVIVGADEIAVAASPSGTAHALVNTDPTRTTFFIGCQDSIINYNGSRSDFNVWKDL